VKPAICIQDLSKLYRLGANIGGYRTLRETISAAAAAPWRHLLRSGTGARSSASPNNLWALHNVSLDIQPGEVVGVIGRNGAGKSTLLKILTRITEPTSGKAVLHGRVGSLLEVGTGFHPELTGRENIYLCGAISGMTRREISRKFDDMVQFAEIGQFLDTPVKRYSSGMFVRLAFAVAAHMEPEILLVDEVLAVGDLAFQKKCLGKMSEVSRSGRTVLFVSHNMATVLNLCEKVALFEHGRLAFLGDCEQGVRRYSSSCTASTGGAISLSEHTNRRQGCSPIVGGLRLLNSVGLPTDQLLCGESIAVELAIDPACDIEHLHFAVGFDDTLGTRLFTLATYLTDTWQPTRSRVARAVCHLGELPLGPGRYCLTINAGPRANVWTDVIDQALWFDITATDFYGNGRLPNADWGRFLVRSRWQSEVSQEDWSRGSR
jgi:lipopolysaccharide transport system ATP-binding protein